MGKAVEKGGNESNLPMKMIKFLSMPAGLDIPGCNEGVI